MTIQAVIGITIICIILIFGGVAIGFLMGYKQAINDINSEEEPEDFY